MEGAAMLDLDSLFAASPAPVTVPNNPQQSPAEKAADKNHSGGGAPAGVPILGAANKSSESLEARGIEPDFTHLEEWQVGHSGHNGNTPVLDQVCPPKSLRHNALSELGTVGTLGTLDNQGGEGRAPKNSPSGGAAIEQFALHPAAVILVLAYCKKVKADNEERISALLNLETMKPGEQVKRWHLSCLEVGLRPWEVLMLPAPSSGLDCTMCKHLTTQHFAPTPDQRRQFHWACSLGFLILETGRATERIWIAPPECSDYQRWVPSAQTLAFLG